MLVRRLWSPELCAVSRTVETEVLQDLVRITVPGLGDTEAAGGSQDELLGDETPGTDGAAVLQPENTSPDDEVSRAPSHCPELIKSHSQRKTLLVLNKSTFS